MFAADIQLKALIHITGDGFFNLTRTAAAVGYHIHTLPPPPPLFTVLQDVGQITDAEMYQVYNMGIGFCVVVAEVEADRVMRIAADHGVQAWRLGTTVASPERTLIIEPRNLKGTAGHFGPLE